MVWNIREYLCTMCSKRFPLSCHLSRHFQDVHLGRTFICNCGVKIKGVFKKATHMRGHKCNVKFKIIYTKAHLVPNLPQNKCSSSAKCWSCKRCFIDKGKTELFKERDIKPSFAIIRSKIQRDDSLIEFVKKTGIKVESLNCNVALQKDKMARFICKICEKRFSSLANRMRHLEDIHKGRTFLCNCGKMIKGLSSANYHKKVCCRYVYFRTLYPFPKSKTQMKNEVFRGLWKKIFKGPTISQSLKRTLFKLPNDFTNKTILQDPQNQIHLETKLLDFDSSLGSLRLKDDPEDLRISQSDPLIQDFNNNHLVK